MTMTALELYDLERLLKKFEETFEGDLPEYSQGEWSRRNVHALLHDLAILQRKDQ